MAETQGTLFESEGQCKTTRKGKAWRRFPLDDAEIIRRYQQGDPATHIAADLGVCYPTIYRRLRQHGVVVRTFSESKLGRPICRERRLPLDESVFDTITEESAYWTGFLMADGGISHRSNGQPAIALQLAEEDRKQVEAFRRFLKSGHKIGYTPPGASGYDNKQGLVKFSVVSSRLVEALQRFGVGPRKSFTATVRGLEDDAHFWRGAVDGDGWVGADVKHGVSYLPVIELAGSLSMVEQFATFARKLAPNCEASVGPQSSIWRFRTTGQYAIPIIRELYESCKVALDRKLAAAKQALTWVPRINDWSHLTLEFLEGERRKFGSWVGVERSLMMPKGVLKSIRRRLSRSS